MRKIFLPVFLVLLMLFAFTACDDDNDDSGAGTVEAVAIIYAIINTCNEAFDDDYYTFTETETDNDLTATYTFKDYTCTVTSYYDGSDIGVTIKSGSTFKGVIDSSWTSAEATYDIDATVDGTSRTLYLKYTRDISTEKVTFSKIELDGAELTGFDALLATAVKGMASRTLAV